MQARAILEAACIVKKEGVDVRPEIMIPLVGTKKELEDQERKVPRRGGRRSSPSRAWRSTTWSAP